MTTLQQARKRERGYHTAFYARHNLGEPNTWLSEPTPYALDSFKLIPRHAHPRALDLGSGIGRHAIPLAKYLGDKSEVVCIDLLDSANKKLLANAQAAGVSQNIKCVTGDIGTYEFQDTFDFILSVSCIEHAASREQLVNLLERLQRITRPEGVHCFMMQTSHVWRDAPTGEPVEPVVELNLPTEEADSMMRDLYAGWQIQDLSTGTWELTESVSGRKTICKSTCLQFTAINKARR